jgi:Yip1 domain
MAALPVSPLPAPAPAPQPAPLSEGARIVNVFIAPSKTFTDLRRNSGWWAPWLLISVFSIGFMFVVGQQISFEQVSRNQISQSARADQFDKLPADQQARQLHIAALVTKYIGYGFPLILLISFAIIAGVLLAAFNLGAGAQVRFATALAIVAYGSLPGIIHATLSSVALFAGVDREGFNIQNPVASNPAYFMTPTGNKFLYGMASALDVFVIWNIVLVGIGFACNSKVKRSTAIILVAALFVLYKLVGSGLAAAFS